MMPMMPLTDKENDSFRSQKQVSLNSKNPKNGKQQFMHAAVFDFVFATKTFLILSFPPQLVGQLKRRTGQFGVLDFDVGTFLT